jgi:LacI family transcriptional regulator
MGVDGLILREQQTRKETEQILATGIPAVTSPYTEPFDGFVNIVSDDAAIGTLAAEHMLHRGFEHFAFCGFGQTYYWSRERAASFTQRIAEAGFVTHVYENECREYRSRLSWDQEQAILVNWLRTLPKPVGLMACNDDRGQYILEACMIGELYVPDEVAVVALGNDQLVCDLTTPPLSSVALSGEKAGHKAAAVLDRLMEGAPAEDESIVVRPTEVVIRQSTNVFAIADLDVLNALNFIHQNASQKPIQVADVLKSVQLSRRTLYDRFAKVLGRSVHEEIKRVRVEQLASLLVNTNRPLSRIAADLGYSDTKNIARYFKQQKGMTPSEYRNSHSVP